MRSLVLIGCVGAVLSGCVADESGSEVAISTPTVEPGATLSGAEVRANLIGKDLTVSDCASPCAGTARFNADGTMTLRGTFGGQTRRDRGTYEVRGRQICNEWEGPTPDRCATFTWVDANSVRSSNGPISSWDG